MVTGLGGGAEGYEGRAVMPRKMILLTLTQQRVYSCFKST
jgi:hypothetical protein